MASYTLLHHPTVACHSFGIGSAERAQIPGIVIPTIRSILRTTESPLCGVDSTSVACLALASECPALGLPHGRPDFQSTTMRLGGRNKRSRTKPNKPSVPWIAGPPPPARCPERSGGPPPAGRTHNSCDSTSCLRQPMHGEVDFHIPRLTRIYFQAFIPWPRLRSSRQLNTL